MSPFGQAMSPFGRAMSPFGHSMFLLQIGKTEKNKRNAQEQIFCAFEDENMFFGQKAEKKYVPRRRRYIYFFGGGRGGRCFQ